MRTAARRLLVVAVATIVAVLAVTALPRTPHAERVLAQSGFGHVDSWSLPTVFHPEGPYAEVTPLPMDVALGVEGRMYVADAVNERVHVFDRVGQRVASWSPPADPPELEAPSRQRIPIAVAAHPNAGRVVVLWLFAADHGLDAPPPSGSPYLLLLDVRDPEGAALAQQAWPTTTPTADVALDPRTGAAFIVDGERLLRLDAASTTVVELALHPGLLGQELSPKRVAALPDGSVLLVRRGMVGIVRLAADGRIDGGFDTLPDEHETFAALDVGPDGRVEVLVHARAEPAPDPLVVAAFDPLADAPLNVRGQRQIAVEGAWRSSDLGGAEPAPDDSWPWALAVTADGLAMITSDGESVVVRRYDAARTLQFVLPGAQSHGVFDPDRFGPLRGPGTLAIERDPTSGELLAMDSGRGRIVSVTGDGEGAWRAAVPLGARAMAIRSGGRLVALTAHDRIIPVTNSLAVTAPWAIPCGCEHGGQLAVAGDVLYVAQPRSRTVAAFDLSTQVQVGTIALPAPVGLWPSDLAVAPDGRLYTADLVGTTVHAWSRPGAPDHVWQAGLLAGPLKLAAGRALDGTAIVAAAMADGFIELHEADRLGQLIARFVPMLGDGTRVSPDDVAIGSDGTLFVADASADGGAGAIHRFRPGAEAPSATPTGDPPPTPTPSASTCSMRGDKVVDPPSIVLGDTAVVTLTLAAECPDTTRAIGADIVLAIDRSSSMSGPKLDAARAAARSFVVFLDVRYHRIGLVSFSSDATVNVPLTADAATVLDGLDRLAAGDQTSIAAGLDAAAGVLREDLRDQVLPVIILLSDGQSDADAASNAARRAKREGVQLYTIALGADADASLLRSLASRPSWFFQARAPGELFPIYREILRFVHASLAGNLVIEDLLAADIRYVPESASPPALVAGDQLRWGRSILAPNGITLTYAIQPQRVGLLPTSQNTVAHYTDADGVDRTFVFPVPEILVVAPTPTATAVVEPTSTQAVLPTPTATPISTARPSRIHLPFAFRP